MCFAILVLCFVSKLKNTKVKRNPHSIQARYVEIGHTVHFHLREIIDLFSLGSLFSHFRPRDIRQGIVSLSILKVFIHIHVTIWKFESKNSQEDYHMVWNGTTNHQAKEVYSSNGVSINISFRRSQSSSWSPIFPSARLELAKAYSGTLSRRNLRRLWAILGDLRRLKQNWQKKHCDFRRFKATLGDLRRL